MNNFLQKLDEIEAQLKKGGELNVQSGSNSRSSYRDSDRRSGSIRISISNRETKVTNVSEKEKEKTMITVDAALQDLEKIEASADSDGVKVVKALKVVVKFLSTMRSNQLLTEADKVNIKKAKETRIANETKKA